MRIIFIIIPMFFAHLCFGQAKTDVSLYYKKGDQQQLDSVRSEKGNLFTKLGHHGPAIENQYYALRLYFNKTTAIDIYSKAESRLEIKEKHWYPSKKYQLSGWGADYYKVGKTIGLGGIRLWDGEQIVNLHPVSSRTARVFSYGDSACMEMTSKGVPYLGKEVDVKVRVTVYSDKREAKVEASSLQGIALQFVTGINYLDELEIKVSERYIATWGLHPEDVAAEKIKVGAAIFIPTDKILEIKKQEDQIVMISKPCQSLSYYIASANAREPEVNTMDLFIKEIEQIIKEK
jgi:hypothetical protein